MGENMNKWKKWIHTAKQLSQGRVTWLVTKDSHKEGSGEDPVQGTKQNFLTTGLWTSQKARS